MKNKLGWMLMMVVTLWVAVVVGYAGQVKADMGTGKPLMPKINGTNCSTTTTTTGGE